MILMPADRMGLTPPQSGDVFGPPLIVIKQANESRQNTSTSTADSELFFPIGPNEQWVVQWNLFVEGNASGDIRVQIAFPSGATGAHCSFGMASASTTSGNLNSGGESLGTSPTADQGTAAPGVGTVIGLLNWSAIINGNTAGNVTLQWAQISANNASPTRLFKGSFLIAHRVR